MGQNLKVALAGTAALLALISVSPPFAEGARYEAFTCKAPDGSPAPTVFPSSGWAPETFGTSPGGGNVLRDDCASGGPLIAELGVSSRQPAPSFAVWTFSAPPSTSLVAFDLDFEGYSRPINAGQPSFGDLGIIDSTRRDPNYHARFQGAGIVARQQQSWQVGGDAVSMSTNLSCTPYGSSTASYCDPGPDGAPARIAIHRATFTLEDRDAPAISSVSGDATTDALWAGSTGISVGATDQGGGVYRLGVEVDGEIKSWLNLAEAPCRAWPGTERTFLSPKPCPSTVGGVQQISTANLPEGPHTVRVLVEDAAGNQTTAYGPTTKTLRRTKPTPTPPPPGPADPGPENGSPASPEAVLKASWEGRESPVRSVRFDQQPVLRGQLTTKAGQPIKDAAVRVTITRDARNSPPFERESLQTNSEGRFRWKMPKGSSSRKITLSYRQRVRDPEPVVSTVLRLRVTAGVRLKLSHRKVRRGQRIKLTGTVVGRPVPGGGKLVELQARNPGKRWITFRTVRSRKSGAFSARYRFRNAGPATFQMRARARKSGDYPYATGSSPVRTIKVR